MALRNDGHTGGAHANSASSYSRDRYGSARHSVTNESPTLDYGTQYAQVDEAAKYSRYRSGAHYSAAAPSYNDNKYANMARTKRKRSLGKRIACILGCVVLASAVACSAYAVWFTSALDSTLASNEDFSSTEEVLVSPAIGEPYYVLVMGSDSREGNETAHADQRGDNERSDVMMLVRVDAENKKITLLSIPRDTPYRLADGSYIKINQVYNIKGAAGAIKAVSELTGLPIAHHVTVRISGLENIVDLLGGVTVDVPIDLSYITTDNKEVTIKAGEQTLNGKEAQIFARARHEFETDQDQNRQSNVRQLMTAIIKKVFDRPLPEIPGIVLKLAEYVDTDYRTRDAASLAMAFAGSDITVNSCSGPSNGEINEAAGNKWLCYPNPEGWAAVVQAVDAGEAPTDIDYQATQIPWSEVTGQPDFKHSLAYHYYYGTHIAEDEEWVYGDVEPFESAYIERSKGDSNGGEPEAEENSEA